MDQLPVKRAILSVTDKSGLVEFASFLHDHKVEIVSTGGTRKALETAGIPVTAVSAVTGFPEILGGRVKTLHPKIHAGILASKDDPLHMQTLMDKGIRPFDLVCVNLYDFALAVRQNLPMDEAVEQIDIGGPCLLRAAAKNFHSVLPVPDPRWYDDVVSELSINDMHAGLPFRQLMAARSFDATARYDTMVAARLDPQRS